MTRRASRFVTGHLLRLARAAVGHGRRWTRSTASTGRRGHGHAVRACETSPRRGSARTTRPVLGANDLVLAVRAARRRRRRAGAGRGRRGGVRRAASARTAARRRAAAPLSSRGGPRTAGRQRRHRLGPGDYAALEAHHALTAGLHVLLFSDNVPLEEEVELKDAAPSLGLLVMGPGAGTADARRHRARLRQRACGAPARGRAWSRRPAPARRRSSALLDRWGVRVSHVIGVGGRDLSDGGRRPHGQGCRPRALEADPGTERILLVSKPPAPAVGARGARPSAATRPPWPPSSGCASAGTAGAACTVRGRRSRPARARPRELAGADAADAVRRPARTRWPRRRRPAGAARRTRSAGSSPAARSATRRSYPRARSSGRCTPTSRCRTERGLPAPDGAHVLPRPRRGGVHPGPAAPDDRPDRPGSSCCASRATTPTSRWCCSTSCSATAPTRTRPGQLARSAPSSMAGGGPQVVAYVLGTEHDPQGYSRQRAVLEEAGCIVTETARPRRLRRRRPRRCGAPSSPRRTL